MASTEDGGSRHIFLGSQETLHPWRSLFLQNPSGSGGPRQLSARLPLVCLRQGGCWLPCGVEALQPRESDSSLWVGPGNLHFQQPPASPPGLFNTSDREMPIFRLVHQAVNLLDSNCKCYVLVQLRSQLNYFILSCSLPEIGAEVIFRLGGTPVWLSPSQGSPLILQWLGLL